MKRWMCLLACLLLALPAVGCGEEMDASAQWLYTQSLTLADWIGQAAGNRAYVSMYTVGETIQEKIAAVGEMDFSAPVAMTICGETEFSALLEQMDAEMTGTLSAQLHQQMERRMLCAIPSMLAGYQGAETLAALNILVMETACAAPEWMQGGMMTVLEYGGDYAVMVCFFSLDNGTVLISAMPAPQSAWEEILPETAMRYSL